MPDKRSFLRLPVVSEGAEYLVMGYLIRRNILTYQAPPGNEGYDLICIHPDPRHRRKRGEKAQVRVQVKSRYAADAQRGFPLKESGLDAFDFLVAVFMNIGRFYRVRDGNEGARPVEFFTFPPNVIRRAHDSSSSWQKVILANMRVNMNRFSGEAGFELITKSLGVAKPRKIRT